MRESLQQSVTRLLRYRRAPDSITRLFRNWKHNADILPRLQSQLEMLLDAYGKFEPVVYDTQGIRDDGSDIVLRYRPENGDGERELICFQAKSFGDLEKKSYLQDLKAQRDDSFRKVLGLRQYFLLLCTDPNAHRDRLRNITAEFRSAYRTEVVEPAFAYTFLHHPKTRVDALIKRSMEAEDLVFRLALDSLEMPSPTARVLVVFLAVRAAFTGEIEFRIEELLGNSILRSTYTEVFEQHEAQIEEPGFGDGDVVLASDFETQFAEDLALLETDFVKLQPHSQAVILQTNSLRPLYALIEDALVRYEYSEGELTSYMFMLMGVRD